MLTISHITLDENVRVAIQERVIFKNEYTYEEMRIKVKESKKYVKIDEKNGLLDV